MKESAKTAISYIRSKAVDFGIKENFYKNMDIHIHIPEGAVPKMDLQRVLQWLQLLFQLLLIYQLEMI